MVECYWSLFTVPVSQIPVSTRVTYLLDMVAWAITESILVVEVLLVVNITTGANNLLSTLAFKCINIWFRTNFDTYHPGYVINNYTILADVNSMSGIVQLLRKSWYAAIPLDP